LSLSKIYNLVGFGESQGLLSKVKFYPTGFKFGKVYYNIRVDYTYTEKYWNLVYSKDRSNEFNAFHRQVGVTTQDAVIKCYNAKEYVFALDIIKDVFSDFEIEIEYFNISEYTAPYSQDELKDMRKEENDSKTKEKEINYFLGKIKSHYTKLSEVLYGRDVEKLISDYNTYYEVIKQPKIAKAIAEISHLRKLILKKCGDKRLNDLPEFIES
jgi:hypothetical protein